MLAVFERIDLSLLDQLLASAAGETSLQMVSFTNQPGQGGGSVPDGLIQARFSYWFEVKTSPNVVDSAQLRSHLAGFAEQALDERLFVITPDPVEPPAIAALEDPRLIWFNFRALNDAIDNGLSDPALLPGERTVFLLRELQALFIEDGLLDIDDVVVVAARVAYGDYLKYGAYVCQPDRSFRLGLRHLGFYNKGAIQRELPVILRVFENVTFDSAAAEDAKHSNDPLEQRLGATIEALLADGRRAEGKHYEVFILSRRDDPQTVELDAPIKNATTGRSGRPFAWTMGQRYTSLSALTRPGVRTTAEL
jgi:hypothetical protein